MRIVLLAGLALLMAAPALAQQTQHAEHGCQTMDTALPAGLEDWKGEAAIATATGDADIAKAGLALGKGYKANLLNTPKVTFAVQPEKPGGSVSFSGLFRFDVPEAGNYVVALGSAAWIDVMEDGKSLEPVSFGHGPECTTIRKMVVFALKPGGHVLQVAGNGAESLKLMVAAKP